MAFSLVLYFNTYQEKVIRAKIRATFSINEKQLEPVATRLYTFSRALHRLQMNFDWLNELPVCFVIGQNDSFNLLLVSQHLNENCSYQQLVCNSITMTNTDHLERNHLGGGVTP